MDAEAVSEVNGSPAAALPVSTDTQSEIGDGSSSLSDIEDKEADQDEFEDDIPERAAAEVAGAQDTDPNDIEIDSIANDSEAETERLHDSPHSAHRRKDVVLNSRVESRTYERSPSKLHKSYHAAEAEEDDLEDYSDDEMSHDGSANTANVNEDVQPNDLMPLEVSGDVSISLPTHDSFNKKRKRSLLPDRRSPDLDELEEPARKRMGLVGHIDDFAVDDAASGMEDNATSNIISGELSEMDSDAEVEDERLEVQSDDEHENSVKIEPTVFSRTNIGKVGADSEHHRRSRSRKSGGRDNAEAQLAEEGREHIIDANEASHVEDEEQEIEADMEADETEAALRNEEEQEKKRSSLDVLSDIQKQFEAFKKTLYDERMAQLDREEALLKSDPPTHPQYLEMMKCIDARREDKLRLEAHLTKFKLESMQRTAVATRAQILAQYSQQVREIRETLLEKTGKIWYDIQADRRGFGSQIEEYAFKFPTRKSQQIMHHNQYTKEVSLLSGIARNVGFPAAPRMNGASHSELAADLEMMGRTTQIRHASHRAQSGLPDLAALRAAGSISSCRPAEEQFIEQTPWANPQHPSHAHLIQRQQEGHHAMKLDSHFNLNPNGRNHPSSGPPLGIFSARRVHNVNSAQAIGNASTPAQPVSGTIYQ